MPILSRDEQETIICFNKEESTADVWTYEVRWQKHIENKLGIKPCKENEWGGKEYKLPKKMIKMPRAKKILSEATKKRMVDRFAKAREARSKSL